MTKILYYKEKNALEYNLYNALCRCFSILGPPGVGKTTTIQCLARHLLGASFKGET